MRNVFIYLCLVYTFLTTIDGQVPIGQKFQPAAWVDVVLEEKEDSACTCLGQLDSACLALFEAKWPAHFCFLKSVCLGVDIEKADSARIYGIRADYYLNAARLAPFSGEHGRRRAMQRYLKGLLKDLERLRPESRILPQTASVATTPIDTSQNTVEGNWIGHTVIEPSLTRMLAINIVLDTLLHWRGISMDEFDQGLTLRVSKKPAILDSLYLHVPQIVIPLEEYLVQSRQYVAKMEIEADLPAIDVGVLTDTVYTGGEVIFRKPWYLGQEMKRATIPSGARMRREELLLLKMMKAGWYFRLSLNDAPYVAEPEYRINAVTVEPRQDLRVHYLFQFKN